MLKVLNTNLLTRNEQFNSFRICKDRNRVKKPFEIAYIAAIMRRELILLRVYSC